MNIAPSTLVRKVPQEYQDLAYLVADLSRQVLRTLQAGDYSRSISQEGRIIKTSKAVGISILEFQFACLSLLSEQFTQHKLPR